MFYKIWLSFYVRNRDILSCDIPPSNRDVISFTLQDLYRQFSVYIHNLLCRNYYISYCLCAGLVQLQSIPQVHYINNATT